MEVMGIHKHSVTLVVNHCRQLGRSVLLLAHYTTVFVAFMVRCVEWMTEAMRWTTLFAQHTVSVFDSVYNYLTWGKRGGVAQEVYPAATTGGLDPRRHLA
ncbi:unnamed protein product [Lota lota]